MSQERESDLTDLQRLRALYQAAPAPEAAENVWNGMLSRVHEAVGGAMAGRQRLLRPWWVAAGLSAAAVFLGIVLARSLWRTDGPPARETPVALTPYPVVDAEEVRIVSMDARDAATLVVGVPPLSGDMVFAQPEDIRVIRCERCPYSGRLAHLDQGGEVPMFVSAVVAPPDDV
jgi:hypothetical protein